jgi:uncharacterized damage-inducible protein DinB
MNTKEIFLKQLQACHDRNTWFVSLQSAINGLTEEQASWKNNEMTNSIWDIVNHLAFYNQRYLNLFKGIPNTKDVDSNNSTFRNTDELSWCYTVELINTIMSDWIKAVQECDQNELNVWSSELAHLTIHTTYHIGQIVHIRKQQGSWDPKQGVN